jgi:hypothetical protein
MEEIKTIFPGEFLKRHAGLAAIAAEAEIRRIGKTSVVEVNLREKNLSIFGGPGTGKSMLAHTRAGERPHQKRMNKRRDG